ncbi:MAG TPA: hypothetical protein VLE53_18270 [Gemmatimonadaceae bacterium]|nr:hypothetical protein [Gemmatimonadaceae bacterium]
MMALTAIPSGTVAGCGAGATAVAGETANLTEPPGIRIEALGGIAALRQVVFVDSASGAAYYTLGPMCPPASQCPVSDSANGEVARASVDGYFGLAAAPAFRALRADYGPTPYGADMREYVVTIFANDRMRTIRADDGSMPSLLSEFVNTVMAGVQAAAGR